MASLKRFVECNFLRNKYPCNLYTFERIMMKNGYIHFYNEHVNSSLESEYWYNPEVDETIEIIISYNASWRPVSRDWNREDLIRLFPNTSIPEAA